MAGLKPHTPHMVPPSTDKEYGRGCQSGVRFQLRFWLCSIPETSKCEFREQETEYVGNERQGAGFAQRNVMLRGATGLHCKGLSAGFRNAQPNRNPLPQPVLSKDPPPLEIQELYQGVQGALCVAKPASLSLCFEQRSTKCCRKDAACLCAHTRL